MARGANHVDLVAFDHADIGFLPIARAALMTTEAAALASHVQDGHREDLHVEYLLYCRLDLGLGGIRKYLEHHLIMLFAHAAALLGNLRRQQNLQ